MSPAIISAHPDPATNTCTFTLDSRHIDADDGLDYRTITDMQKSLTEAHINFMRESIITEEVARDEHTITVKVSLR